MAKTTILVVEDDAAIRRGLCDVLRHAGYSITECARGDAALETGKASRHDLALLDVLLPGMDGFELLQALRVAQPRLPVIMLTARGAAEDRVRGLKLGADDYVVKPFDVSELLARVEAVLRRSAERPSDIDSLELGDRVVRFDRLEVELAGGEIRRLSEMESAILRYLAVHRGRVIERGELLQQIWGGNPHEMETRTVDMHISRLRDKIEANPARPRLILTVRSKGYRLA